MSEPQKNMSAAEINKLICAYVAAFPDVLPASAVPEQMRKGKVDKDGWVEWQVTQAMVDHVSLAALENQQSIKIPVCVREYLSSCCHLLEQVHSSAYQDTLVMMTPVPGDSPLQPLAELIAAWRPLIDCGYFPIALWGDAWGPVCIDISDASKEPAPLVWFDHSELNTVKERSRASLHSLAKPLYPGFREFMLDILTPVSPH
ncbi:hypothetical protein L2725_20305 [Shewanella corallii]|uniref:Uncharacterized protein n=1 Tax=Shewanella corallii TaxID=560080 RepID=A0ABT0NC94_9GAMM|nr:hypothetical protein [Shewanella corallii]MCL2916088.1 hypothetical protein [Shewanella corallii]